MIFQKCTKVHHFFTHDFQNVFKIICLYTLIRLHACKLYTTMTIHTHKSILDITFRPSIKHQVRMNDNGLYYLYFPYTQSAYRIGCMITLVNKENEIEKSLSWEGMTNCIAFLCYHGSFDFLDPMYLCGPF